LVVQAPGSRIGLGSGRSLRIGGSGFLVIVFTAFSAAGAYLAYKLIAEDMRDHDDRTSVRKKMHSEFNVPAPNAQIFIKTPHANAAIP